MQFPLNKCQHFIGVGRSFHVQVQLRYVELSVIINHNRMDSVEIGKLEFLFALADDMKNLCTGVH